MERRYDYGRFENNRSDAHLRSKSERLGVELYSTLSRSLFNRTRTNWKQLYGRIVYTLYWPLRNCFRCKKGNWSHITFKNNTNYFLKQENINPFLFLFHNPFFLFYPDVERWLVSSLLNWNYCWNCFIKSLYSVGVAIPPWWSVE